MDSRLLIGDSLTMLKGMASASVDCVITSPPYWMQREYAGGGDGQEQTIAEYVGNLVNVFRECVRVIKPTGNIVFNLGDKYHKKSLSLVPYRFAIAATESDRKIRLVNEITWVKKNPTPRQFSRRLVATTEPFFHFAKSDDYYFDPANFYIDGEASKPVKHTEQLGKGYESKIEGSPLSAAEKADAFSALALAYDKVSKGEIAGFRMKIRGVHKDAFGGQDGGRAIQMRTRGFTVIYLRGNKMKRDIIEWGVGGGRGIDHPATFPAEMIEKFVDMLCPPNGVVLDPYIGAGSTALAATKQGRKYIGIDISEKYIRIAKDRLAQGGVAQ